MTSFDLFPNIQKEFEKIITPKIIQKTDKLYNKIKNANSIDDIGAIQDEFYQTYIYPSSSELGIFPNLGRNISELSYKKEILSEAEVSRRTLEAQLKPSAEKPGSPVFAIAKTSGTTGLPKELPYTPRLLEACIIETMLLFKLVKDVEIDFKKPMCLTYLLEPSDMEKRKKGEVSYRMKGTELLIRGMGAATPNSVLLPFGYITQTAMKNGNLDFLFENEFSVLGLFADGKPLLQYAEKNPELFKKVVELYETTPNLWAGTNRPEGLGEQHFKRFRMPEINAIASSSNMLFGMTNTGLDGFLLSPLKAAFLLDEKWKLHPTYNSKTGDKGELVVTGMYGLNTTADIVTIKDKSDLFTSISEVVRRRAVLLKKESPIPVQNNEKLFACIDQFFGQNLIPDADIKTKFFKEGADIHVKFTYDKDKKTVGWNSYITPLENKAEQFNNMTNMELKEFVIDTINDETLKKLFQSYEGTSLYHNVIIKDPIDKLPVWKSLAFFADKQYADEFLWVGE